MDTAIIAELILDAIRDRGIKSLGIEAPEMWVWVLGIKF
jgi:hypothetical protein